ncbi:hypothetical protein TNCV_3650051 [Trichonephila clavipes]|nr:hypothetical protein TNCV_3650051 [Trichonephila clavipes]
MRQANQQFSSIHTKIGNGEQLDEVKIALIESRFCTVEEVEARFPQGFIKDWIYVPRLPADLSDLRYRMGAVVARTSLDIWDELTYRFDVGRVTNEAHIEQL